MLYQVSKSGEFEGTAYQSDTVQVRTERAENGYVCAWYDDVPAWAAEYQGRAFEAQAENNTTAGVPAVVLTEEQFADVCKRAVRQERTRRLTETDYLLASDYPISAGNLEKVKTYRQALRDMPEQDGFPWNGDITAVPWPVLDLDGE